MLKSGSFVPRLAGALLVGVFLLFGAGDWPGKAAGAATGSGWRVIGARTINVGGQNGGIISLSPNGKWLAVWRQGQQAALCFYVVIPLHQARCTNLPQRLGAYLDPTSMVWSPDSTHVAFTENIDYIVNCDIWVLDLATGVLRDLTPDGATNAFLDPHYKGPKALIDLVPAWSPDSKTLLFARSVVGGHDTSLYRIPVTGGTPTRVAVIAAEPYALYHGLYWLPDGRILYTPSFGDQHDPRNGLWLLGAGGGQPRQLLKPDPTMGAPLLLQVSTDARTALIFYPQYTVAPNSSAFAVVDLNSGAVHPLGSPPGAQQPALGPWSASLSPDGAWLFCLYGTGSPITSVGIRSVRGGQESPLPYRLAGVGSRESLDGMALDWVGDTTIYVSTGELRGVLLTLRRG